MKTIISKACLILLLGCLLPVFIGAFELSRLPDVSALKTKNPKRTALMEWREREYREKTRKPPRQQIWASYAAVSEHLKKAILLGEDASFFSHGGIDFYELKEAMKKDWKQGGFKRGGSTITMQLARNLYLNPSKNVLRKLREIAIAWKLERTLSKQRIFELYLNVVEWGPEIYGAEAASRHYFGKSASRLDAVEAATLAALLPNPRAPQETALLYRRNVVLKRMARTGALPEEELEAALNSPLFRRLALWERLLEAFE